MTDSEEEMLDDLDLSSLPDERTRTLIVRLLNIIEEVSTDNRALRDEVQRLRDENNRLKGEQAKPTVRPQPKAKTDHSSEAERRRPGQRGKREKRELITIHHDRIAPIDPASLPPDAIFKGYDQVIVQDIVVRADNVLFRKEVWYSPSMGKSYRADLPAPYTGEFGPGIRALVLVLYFGCQTSESKICLFLTNLGVQIAEGTISNLLIKRHETFHTEKAAVLEAGLASSPWQHIDDTPTRVDGHNQSCQVVCNPLYTVYQTSQSKSRLSVLSLLWGGRECSYLLNQEALSYLARLSVSQLSLARLMACVPYGCEVTEGELTVIVATTEMMAVPAQQLTWMREALAVAAYHAQSEWPVVRLLVCDDAPQWVGLSEELAGCWVHEGRHYKKLTPFVERNRVALADFVTKFWGYYDELLS
jgi:hypothetical protein